MWVEMFQTPNLVVAELWKELFDGEAVIGLVVPATEDWVAVGEAAPRRVMVPVSKKHVAEEVLRKL